jgi:hypothetical protein
MNDDMTERERRIRRRAHQLWREAGQPEGRDQEFWERAEVEIDYPVKKDDPAGKPIGN